MVNPLHTDIKPFPAWLFAALIAVAISLSVMMLYSYINKSSATNKQPRLETQYQTLLAQPDVINTLWMRTLNPAMKKVEGNIVWSTNKQQGIMLFTGLPASKKNQQYQLWIYDLESTANSRIAGHIFSIKDNNFSKILVPVNAEGVVKIPYKFELVLKHPNHDKEDTLLLAQP